MNKTILVTGASTGIGRSCALRLAREGFRVFAGVRTHKAAEELVQDASGSLQPIILDITDKQHIQSAVEMFGSEGLYGLVNNAGMAALGPLEFVPLEKIRKQFDVNLFGHIAITQALLPSLRKTEGRIVNMSSVSGFIAFPFFGAYACSKFAMEAFNDALRRELQPWNIQVSLVEPGNIQTPIWEKSFRDSMASAAQYPPEFEKYYGRRDSEKTFSTEKMMEPEKVANAVLRALTSKKPCTRYVVGTDCRKYSLLKRVLPDRILDKFM